jgi:hypothetical protein
MRLIRPLLRLGGWVLVIIGPFVGFFAFLMTGGRLDSAAAAIAWVVVVVAFGSSAGAYWLLRRTSGDEPGISYQPSSVLGELAVPVLTKLNEGSRPFTRGGIGIVTFAAWLVAVVVLAATWGGVAMLLSLIMIGIAAGFEAVGIILPNPVGWIAVFLVLVVPIAAAILVYQWAMRRPAIRYWLR